jgi:hypothetical protein
VRERSRPLYGLMGPDQGGTVFGVARNWLRILRCRIMGLTPTLWRQRPERWLSRSLKRHPLICFALVLFAGQCACAFAMELLIPKPSPLRGYVTSIFLPLGLSFVAAGLLLAFGEWKAAASPEAKVIVVVGLGVECILLPFVHYMALAILVLAGCYYARECI